jgi:hypothetical protein
MTIRDVAEQLNKLSAGYKIGDLQNLRKEIKNLRRRPGSLIFHDDTISDEGWAYHYGGRKELQFNIGFEEEGLRYGIALSLESSQTLPDITLLYPTARRLNQFMRQHSEFFRDYLMWYWQDEERSAIGPVREISEALLKPKTFIFIGKLQKENDTDFDSILTTFDELLKPYIFVEKTSESGIIEDAINENDDFAFQVQTPKLSVSRDYSIEEKAINLDIRHTLIQETLIKKLRTQYGDNNVIPEHPIGGKKIDVVLKSSDDFIFYEIKVSGSAKACIRDAMGQLMEYAYWPGKRNASSLVVIGEEAIDDKTMSYLKYLNNTFALPLHYEQIIIDNSNEAES